MTTTQARSDGGDAASARSARPLRRRRLALGAALGVLVLGGARTALADGNLTIAPTNGPPGTTYAVEVTCGHFPEVEQRHTQDAPVQGTIGPFSRDHLIEVSPSRWRADEVAGQTDEEYGATCEGVDAGRGRFDAESPHLWFGPRPQYIGDDQLAGRTTAEGTDCPAGTEATVRIIADHDWVFTHTAPIDQYGDWSVPLPEPVGDADLEVVASCGSVTYDRLTARSTSTTTTSVPLTSAVSPAATPSTPAPATPASPQEGTASFTG